MCSGIGGKRTQKCGSGVTCRPCLQCLFPPLVTSPMSVPLLIPPHKTLFNVTAHVCVCVCVCVRARVPVLTLWSPEEYCSHIGRDGQELPKILTVSNFQSRPEERGSSLGLGRGNTVTQSHTGGRTWRGDDRPRQSGCTVHTHHHSAGSRETDTFMGHTAWQAWLLWLDT